jgi:predicted RNA-binding protein with PUA-like domain
MEESGLMAYWLFKSEPSTWSWDDQVAKGAEGEEWDGVRNYQARNFMRAMKLGDKGFFYHSQSEKAIVGLIEICAEAHPDSKANDPRWDCVDIRALEPVRHPVTLERIKADPALADMVLVKSSRLSVQPVTEPEWRHICALAGVSPD